MLQEDSAVAAVPAAVPLQLATYKSPYESVSTNIGSRDLMLGAERERVRL